MLWLRVGSYGQGAEASLQLLIELGCNPGSEGHIFCRLRPPKFIRFCRCNCRAVKARVPLNVNLNGMQPAIVHSANLRDTTINTDHIVVVASVPDAPRHNIPISTPVFEKFQYDYRA